MIVSLLPVILLLAFLSLRMPIAFALGLAGLIGIFLDAGWRGVVVNAGSVPYTAVAKYSLVLIPMFILMGLFISHSGMVRSVFSGIERLTKRLPAGLPMATVFASTLFGAVTGSSVANAATIGRVSVSEMSRKGYDKAFAAALVAAAGAVAILIPPSIGLVLYAVLASESVGKLLLAGVIPGLVTMVVLIVFVLFLAKGAHTDGEEKAVTVGESQGLDAGQRDDGGGVGLITFSLVGVVSLFVILMGGIYSGLFTSTEAGAVGALAALVIASIYVAANRQRGRNAWRRMVFGSLAETGSMTAMLFALLIGSAIFSHYMVVSGLTHDLVGFLTGLDVEAWVILVGLIVIFVLAGMVMDGTSLLLILTPIAYPIITDLGYDGIWFGIIMIKSIEIGLLTPPVGLNVFVLAGIFPDLKAEAIFRRVLPFVLAEFVVIALLIAFPSLATWLPEVAAVRD